MKWPLRTLLVLAGLAVLATSISLWIYRDIPAAELEAKYALPQSRFVELDGVRMHVFEQGEGPAIVRVYAHYANLRSDRSGNQLELTPENTFLVAATYRAPLLTTGFDWFIDGDVRWEDQRLIDDSNSAYLDSHSLANLRFGVSGARWDVTAYVDNVFDDVTIRVGGNGPSLARADFRTGLLTQPPPPTQTIAGVYLPNGTFGTLPLPRIFGVRATYRFGNRD